MTEMSPSQLDALVSHQGYVDIDHQRIPKDRQIHVRHQFYAVRHGNGNSLFGGKFGYIVQLSIMVLGGCTTK